MPKREEVIDPGERAERSHGAVPNIEIQARSAPKKRETGALLLMICCLATPAAAQETPTGTPPAAEPSASAPEAGAAPPATAPPRDDPTFDVLEFDVEGNSVLSTRDIERAVMPFLGEKKHIADVEAARKALENLYQKRGYQTVFVDIPEQRIVAGVIRLHVLQGEVGQLRVTGTRYFELGEIRTRMSEFKPGSVPNFNTVQQEIAQVNRTPDRQVAPILSPGKVPGTVDVDLSVKDHLPLHGELSLDNHASPFTSALRASAALHYDNLWQSQHSVALNFQMAPEKPGEANVVYGTYLWRFAERDDLLSFYGIRSNSRVAVVGNSTILGDAKIVGLRWIKPIGNGSAFGGSYFNTFTLGFDHKAFGQTNISAQTGFADVLPPISYVPFSMSIGSLWRRPSTTIQASLSANTAPRGLFGNSDLEFEGRRVNGGTSYLAWKYDLSLETWLIPSLSAYAHYSGQWTSDPLIPNEQLTIGGAESVRGYREAELSGDHGYQATLEGRYYPWSRPAEGSPSLYVLVFGDLGEIGLVDPLGPQLANATIASAGLGLREQGWHGVTTAFDVAQILRNGGRGTGGYITRTGEHRIDFSIGYGF
jgi:hemolysin activation/secretion protein